VPYAVDLALSGFHLRHKRAHALLARDFVSWLRIEFLGTAARAGVLEALLEPRTVDELAKSVGASNAGLLESLLRAGEAVGEVARDRDGRWRLTGVRARAMVDPAVDGLAALPEEAVAYGSDVYRRLGERLRGAPAGDYLGTHGELVARTSRVAEPVLGPLVTDVVRQRRVRRVLDVGCGSGVNMRHVATASAAATGAGIDVDPAVVALARRSLAAWGLADRFAVHEADVRHLPDELAGPWDLVLLLQNVYYFDGADRTELLRGLRLLTGPGGAVLVATAVPDARDPAAAHLDVVLRSTVGNTPLPTVAELRADLTAAGFTRVEVRHLAPIQPLRAIVAS
jgi:4-hydroxy-2,2'-bipyrrole-5-carbaldehyde O-methyltransferase